MISLQTIYNILGDSTGNLILPSEAVLEEIEDAVYSTSICGNPAISPWVKLTPESLELVAILTVNMDNDTGMAFTAAKGAGLIETEVVNIDHQFIPNSHQQACDLFAQIDGEVPFSIIQRYIAQEFPEYNADCRLNYRPDTEQELYKAARFICRIALFKENAGKEF